MLIFSDAVSLPVERKVRMPLVRHDADYYMYKKRFHFIHKILQ